MTTKRNRTMSNRNIEELNEVLKQGYTAALDSAFSLHDMYATGFIHGMKYQEDGTIPKSKWIKLIEEIEKEIKDNNQTTETCQTETKNEKHIDPIKEPIDITHLYDRNHDVM